ncbi:MAG: hypothetical protein KDD12_27875, partial [Lewinella sp.]|nr:hypothetical protein [Lewinella sp.]
MDAICKQNQPKNNHPCRLLSGIGGHARSPLPLNHQYNTCFNPKINFENNEKRNPDAVAGRLFG